MYTATSTIDCVNGVIMFYLLYRFISESKKKHKQKLFKFLTADGEPQASHIETLSQIISEMKSVSVQELLQSESRVIGNGSNRRQKQIYRDTSFWQKDKFIRQAYRLGYAAVNHGTSATYGGGPQPLSIESTMNICRALIEQIKRGTFTYLINGENVVVLNWLPISTSNNKPI